METLPNKNINFISEQDGSTEREFKNCIIDMLLRLNKEVRVYLAQVYYDETNKELNVAICYKLGNDEFDKQEILNETVNIFRSMFSCRQHLDIIFLDFAQEKMLREVCCPFFTSPMFQVQQPDFYLTSEEGYALKSPIACFKKLRYCYLV